MSSPILVPIPSILTANKLLTIFIAVAISILAYYTFNFLQKPTVIVVGYEVKNSAARKQQYTFGARQLVGNAYKSLKDRIFAVDTVAGTKLILPHTFAGEIANNSNLSFQSALDEDLLVDYTYMGGVSPAPLTVFKRDINSNLGSFVSEFQDLIVEHIESSFGRPEDWTPFSLYPITLRMLGILTARVMISKDAPHDKDWVTLTTDYVLTGIKYAQSLKEWPAFLRPVVCYFLPQYGDVQFQLDGGRRMILKTIADADAREEKGLEPEKPISVLYSMTRKPEEKSGAFISFHMREQLNLAVGGIHTTSSVLTQSLFELAWHSEYVPILREEIQDTLEKHGGQLDKAALWDMWKMDSFIREAHRLNSPNLTTLQRRALRSTTLSDGTHIPKGGKLEFATFAIHRDEDFYENANKFDGLRFYRARQADPDSKHHYVTVRPDYLGWGLGREACPGRFLADVEIKLILSFILQNYEIKSPPGKERPVNVEFENQVFPNPVDQVLIKRRA